MTETCAHGLYQASRYCDQCEEESWPKHKWWTYLGAAGFALVILTPAVLIVLVTL